jgi:hypothetical protein
MGGHERLPGVVGKFGVEGLSQLVLGAAPVLGAPRTSP